MSKKVRHIKLYASTRELLKTLPINTSAAISQAVLNVRDDDGLLLKALKRRLAIPPVKGDELERIAVNQDERVSSYLTDLSARSQLSIEEVTRLCIEAYLFKL